MSSSSRHELMERNSEPVTALVRRELQKEKEREGSFFAIIPEGLKSYIERLARENWDHYKKRFPNFDNFLETMAENWLIKVRSFGRLAEAAGLEDLGLNAGERISAESFVAVLTTSASYVLAGKGVFTAGGGDITYVRMPLRKGEHSLLYRLPNRTPDGAEEVLTKKGISVRDKPTRGERWRLPGLVTTSPLLSIYGGIDHEQGSDHSAQTLSGLHGAVTRSFRRIDHDTFNGPRNPEN